jgi:hypothetical protein
MDLGECFRTKDAVTCGVATSDNVVPPQAASERPANGTNQANCRGGPLRSGFSGVQDPYYLVARFESMMARWTAGTTARSPLASRC